MKSKERASGREPSHTLNFIRVALIVFAAILVLIVLAKLVAYTKFLGLKDAKGTETTSTPGQ